MKPWEYPDCPECESNVFVSETSSTTYDWKCYLCDRGFDDVD